MSNVNHGFRDSFRDAKAITPSDTDNLPDGPCRGIYVGGAGAVKVIPGSGGTAVTFAAVPVGTVLDVVAVRVYATGTTATNLLALY